MSTLYFRSKCVLIHILLIFFLELLRKNGHESIWVYNYGAGRQTIDKQTKNILTEKQNSMSEKEIYNHH